MSGFRSWRIELGVEERDANAVAGREIRAEDAGEEAGIHGHSGIDAGSGNRGKHGDFQLHRRGDAQESAGEAPSGAGGIQMGHPPLASAF